MKDFDIFIYVSSPVMELRGGIRIGQVWHGTPEEVWCEVSEFAEVKRCEFDAYFEGRNVAYALEIIETWEYENPITLSSLRDQFPDFVVPQSWRYAKSEERMAFQAMERVASS